MNALRAYYNEHDPFAADWLRELVKDGLLPAGDVDERDIRDVLPSDLAGYAACHFFAGIGGWPYALRLAGWPDDRPVWTGSCPCQPFSAAGRGDGFADERHLWPAFFHLIGECRPSIVFGEQVASKDGLGWLDLVQSDMEGAGYAFGAADLCAAGIGAPHIRQRLFWVADSLGSRLEGRDARALGHEREAAERSGETGAVGDAYAPGLRECSERDGQPNTGIEASCGADALRSGPWSDIIWLPCRDGKARPAQPGILPLAHGVPNRVGTLRGAGNAIVPQVAAEFLRACT